MRILDQFPNIQVEDEHAANNKMSVTAGMESLCMQPTYRDETFVVYFEDKQPVTVPAKVPTAPRNKEKHKSCYRRKGNKGRKRKESK